MRCALRRGGSDWAKGEERSPWPSPQINQRILRPFPLPPLSLRGGEASHSTFFVSLLAREFFLAKRITGVAEGRHKTIHVHGHGLRAAPLVGCFTFRSATRNREQFNRPWTGQTGSLINGYRVSRASRNKEWWITSPVRLFEERLPLGSIFTTKILIQIHCDTSF